MAYLVQYVLCSWLLVVFLPSAIGLIFNQNWWGKLNAWWWRYPVLGLPRYVVGLLHKALGGGAKTKKKGGH